ncbi:leucine-rich repeat protein [Lactococcus nasutitermitis]|uniref:Leucine-rich repeat protein n=1 Tax=Lactococcus nasutitermitis TaxID=1652957 RepID=A0ABV9JH91_9LACT|nr:leucine-rich repeat protein [Lactococcus nasutitermitis]
MSKYMAPKIVVGLGLLTLQTFPAGKCNCGFTPLIAHAASNTSSYTDSQNVVYTLDLTGKTATVSSYTGEAGANIVIPDKLVVNGIDYSITSIGSYAFSNTGIQSVIIGNNVTDISTSAFQTTTAYPNYYKQALTKVILGQNVQTIKTDAFAGNAITQIEFPKGLTKIATRAFANNFLTEVSFGSNLIEISSKAFQSNTIQRITFANDANTLINSEAFSGSPVISLTLGAGVTWTSDALNKVSPFFNQLSDMPATGIRIVSIDSKGMIQKSWINSVTTGETEQENVDTSSGTESFSENDNQVPQSDANSPTSESLENTSDVSNSDNPNTSEISDTVKNMDMPEVSDTSEISSGPEGSDTAEVSDTEKAPDTTKSSDTVEVPNTSDNSDITEVPDTAEIQDTVDIPDTLEIPNAAETSDMEEIPNTSDNSDITEVPDTAETQDAVDIPDTLEIPNISETSDMEEIPNTSDTSDITEVPDAVDIPDTLEIPNVAETSDMEEIPNMSDNSDITEVPDTAETQDAVDIPDTLEIPNISETSDITEIPNVSDNSNTTEVPDIVNIPDTLEIPNISETSDMKEIPNMPDNSDTTEVPDTVEIQNTSDNSEIPNMPDNSETTGISNTVETPDTVRNLEMPNNTDMTEAPDISENLDILGLPNMVENTNMAKVPEVVKDLEIISSDTFGKKDITLPRERISDKAVDSIVLTKETKFIPQKKVKKQDGDIATTVIRGKNDIKKNYTIQIISCKYFKIVKDSKLRNFQIFHKEKLGSKYIPEQNLDNKSFLSFQNNKTTKMDNNQMEKSNDYVGKGISGVNQNEKNGGTSGLKSPHKLSKQNSHKKFNINGKLHSGKKAKTSKINVSLVFGGITFILGILLGRVMQKFSKNKKEI